MDLLIRRARPGDKRDVLAAVRTIWGGNDRIPDVFDSWVTHRSGPFFVAESAGHVVGMGKLTVVSPGEAWLEGGRVAPRWRRKGIATALIAHRIAYARDRGFGVLRFSTASDNTPIQRAARGFGFTLVRRFARLDARAHEGSLPSRARRAHERAMLRRVGPLIQRGPAWEWREIARRDLRNAIARGRAFVSDDRVGAAAILGDRDEQSMVAVAIGGRERPLRKLLIGLRAEAHRRGLAEVSLHASTALERRAAGAAGYRRPWLEDACLYEKRLMPPAG